jgi:small-conductance mechanosensitive channel
VKILDNLAFTVGQLRISLYLVIKSFLVMTLFIWGARYLSTLTEHIIETSETLTPVVKVLISKLIRISFMTIAIVVGMGSLGIDLTAFAVFSGAIGVGIGFGLQKVVSNLISGIILLMDNSLKPGDVIEVGDKYGWIEAMNARYVSIKVWDGTEQLIPNEDMITNKVINWSYTNNLILISVNFGVSYKSDLHLVRKLALDSLQNLERILTEPSAQCYLIEFGDSSVNFKLAFWINDPKNGLANIKSAVLFNLWDIFQANNIEIPFPQRDIHIKRTIIPADTRIN